MYCNINVTSTAKLMNWSLFMEHFSTDCVNFRTVQRANKSWTTSGSVFDMSYGIVDKDVWHDYIHWPAIMVNMVQERWTTPCENVPVFMAEAMRWQCINYFKQYYFKTYWIYVISTKVYPYLFSLGLSAPLLQALRHAMTFGSVWKFGEVSPKHSRKNETVWVH